MPGTLKVASTLDSSPHQSHPFAHMYTTFSQVDLLSQADN